MERVDEPLPLDGLLRSEVGAVRQRLGEPRVDRRVGADRWLLLERPGVRVRIRARDDGGGEERVASWTATFAEGRGSLREATERLGLWPRCAPDARASEAGPLLRRPLPEDDGSAVHTLTARVRAGRIVQVTAFDEPPDWLEEPPSETGGAA